MKGTMDDYHPIGIKNLAMAVLRQCIWDATEPWIHAANNDPEVRVSRTNIARAQIEILTEADCIQFWCQACGSNPKMIKDRFYERIDKYKLKGE